MRGHWLLTLFVTLAAIPAAFAQLGISGDAGSGLSNSGAVQLAQFQPGIAPRASSFDLGPGASYRVALNCIDLFADTPTDRVAFQAPATDAVVVLASGQELSLGDAIGAGLVQVRGSTARVPGPRTAGLGFDVTVMNLSALPLRFSVPVGTLLVPAGQPIPEVLPGVRRLLAVAQSRGLLGSSTLAEAVWATRGFTRADVAQTAAAPLSDVEAGRVQDLLTAANLGYDFGQDDGEYARLYEGQRAALAHSAEPASGWAMLPDGRRARAELLASDTGRAVVRLTMPRTGSPLYYAGKVLSRRPDRLRVQLIQLKTGRPLEALRGPLTVKLADV
jgi:hypothetical protein